MYSLLFASLRLCLTLLLLLGSQEWARAGVRVGAAKVSITPDVALQPTPLGGYAARRGAAATGVHDPIFARSLVMTDGRGKVALVSADLCFVPGSLKAEVVKRVAALGVTGLDAAHLLLTATHCHSAPDPLAMHQGNTFQNIKGWTPFSAALLDFCAGRIAESVRLADARLAGAMPARLRVTERDAGELNRNRRGDPVTDGALTGLDVDDGKGWRTLFVNFASHPTLYSDKMREVSADWPGVMTAALERTQGPDGVCLFLNGAEGDAAPQGAVGATESERVTDYGQRVAASALAKRDAPNASRAVQGDVLAAWTQEIVLPTRRPTGMFLVAAAQLGLSLVQGREFVTRLMPATASLHFVRIGDVLLLGFPCEPTGALGLAAKRLARAAGYKTALVVALTDDWLAYALTPEQYKAGKYEAMMSFYGAEFGPALLQAVAQGVRHTAP